MGDVTRKASLMWKSNRNKRPSMDGAGSHHVLQQSNDDGVPLDELDNRLVPSPQPDQSLNPFATPNVSTTSLNQPYDSAVMTASSSSTPTTAAAVPPKAVRRPTLETAKSHPPPEPLDLPKPRTPPPRVDTPHANRPPEPTAPPRVEARAMPEVEEVPQEKSRWWTDWLCGCVEKDEDKQAARTNPFE